MSRQVTEILKARSAASSGDRTPPAVPVGLPRRRRVRSSRVAISLSLGWVAFLVIVTLTVQWFPIHNYTTIVGNPNLPPSWTKEFLGTDQIGRSNLSRLLFGARVSVIISFIATSLSFAVGSLIGLMGVYFSSVANVIADVIANSILSVPVILLILTIILAFGTNVVVLTLGLSVIFIPAFMRLMRANAQSQMAREYIAAARSLGASGRRIIFRELLPNTAPQLLSYAVIVLPVMMITEGTLSFLGFGVPSPTPSWGQMISLGSQNITTAPWPTLIPCLMLVVTVYSLNTIGDWLRTRLDVREMSIR